jgi:dipeptidase E
LKLLLTSGGVTNPSIHSALVQLLGKPIAECHALVVPTAQWGHPMCGPASVRGLVAAEPDFRHFSGLGWASLGVLELTALPTIGAERWVPWIQEADVLLVDGGDATYLCHWMRESGLADLLFPHLNAFPGNALADAERWAAAIGVPAYAIDEQTAIQVVDGSVEVVSEGQWTKFSS